MIICAIELILDRVTLSNLSIVPWRGTKRRLRSGPMGEDPDRIDNTDVHNARVEYSEYFLREIDDEVHKHMPEYEKELDVLRALGKWQFDRAEFEAVYEKQSPERKPPMEVLESLYEFSFIGFYRAGGRGFGGRSIWVQVSRAPYSILIQLRASKFRIHPGPDRSHGPEARA